MRAFIVRWRGRRLAVLFVLMVLLPSAVFAVLIARAMRADRLRAEYDTTLRQRHIATLLEADLRTWLFSDGRDSAQTNALVRFEVDGDRLVFPAFDLSLSVRDAPRQRPFVAALPDTPLTVEMITEQYFPRIAAFLRDRATGRNAGTQYFPRLRALVVQPPGTSRGYVVDMPSVLTHVNRRLATLSASEPFNATVWMREERTSQPPAAGITLEGFSFFDVVFEQARPGAFPRLRDRAFAYSMALLVLVTVMGSILIYRAVSQEARLAKLRSDFVAAVSHEFRSPLASILALAERVDRVDDPARRLEYHRIIREDARRLDALVTRLLDFAVIEEGKQAYSREPVDLVAAARAAVDACQRTSAPGRVRLHGGEASPLWVHGDHTALSHAIQNVIENALKYSAADSPVVVQCGSVNGSHVVEVQDRGIGIPASEQPRIFDKFYRGRHVSELNVQGVGIGLALVRHVVERHGGTVTVDSQPGEGSRFHLRVPRMEA